MRRIVAFLGADLAVAELRPSHVEKYLAHRIAGGHAPAGRRDLVSLSIAANWAEGEELLAENPLSSKRARAAMRVAHEPKRPFRTKADYEALRGVADRVDAPPFRVLLDLAWHTGHRIGAILGLRWENVSLDRTPEAPFGTITWYAGLARDRKKHEHTLPMNEEAFGALMAWRRECGRMPVGFVFASPVLPTQPLDRTGPKKWLSRAEQLAKIPHQKQGGWHMFRRGWATARKHLPLQDVAKGGGWTDTATVTLCYQHATIEDTRNAALFVA